MSMNCIHDCDHRKRGNLLLRLLNDGHILVLYILTYFLGFNLLCSSDKFIQFENTSFLIFLSNIEASKWNNDVLNHWYL